MGGDFSGKNQDCSKGIYALAGNSFWVSFITFFLNIIQVVGGKDLEVQCRILRVINAVLPTYLVSLGYQTGLERALLWGTEILIVCVVI